MVGKLIVCIKFFWIVRNKIKIYGCLVRVKLELWELWFYFKNEFSKLRKFAKLFIFFRVSFSFRLLDLVVKCCVLDDFVGIMFFFFC